MYTIIDRITASNIILVDNKYGLVLSGGGSPKNRQIIVDNV